jgi:hypothetical protein
LQDRIMSNVSIGVPYFFSEISSLTQRSSGWMLRIESFPPSKRFEIT